MMRRSALLRMLVTQLLGVAPILGAFAPLAPPCARCGRRARASQVSMAGQELSPEERIAQLESSIRDLKISALEKKLADLKAGDGPADDAQFAEVARGLAELRQGLTVPAPAAAPAPAAPQGLTVPAPAAAPAPAAPQPPSPPPAPPPVRVPKALEKFPFPEALGIAGQRCAVIFYAYDGPTKLAALLETFEDEAAEFAACGCALVAARRVVRTDSADERKAAEYEERFPTFNFVDGLDVVGPRCAVASPTLARGLGGASWFDIDRALYYEPLVVLLDPDGGMRSVLSHRGLSASGLLGQTLRALHEAVPRAGERISAAEAEANRQALYKENVEWAEVLKEDESLRQPTRYWFDGVLSGRGDDTPLLRGVDAAALPGAIDRYLEGGGEADDGVGGEEEEEAEPLVSKDGVQAPAWYATAKRTAERKQEAERALWNGTAPSAAAGPLPLGPAGARLKPLEGYTRKALREASAQQRAIAQAFFREWGGEWGGDALRALTGGDGGGGASGTPDVGGSPAGASPSPPRSAATESALLRAQMLALGLSRSATSTASTRRLRLLRELEASVSELVADGFDDRATLGELKAQIKESYASAPPEFLEEASASPPAPPMEPRDPPPTQAACASMTPPPTRKKQRGPR